MSNYLLPIYNKLPITLTHGQGLWLYDQAGHRYLDALSGIGVSGLGHNHPAITKVICEQAQKLLHIPNNYQSETLNALAESLCHKTKMAKAYFSNSGTEANEAAIKMARKFGQQKGYASPKIIVMEQGFHGRSLGAWSASGKHQEQTFGPLLNGFITCPFDDIEAISQLSDKHKDICAILLEPVLGKGGCQPHTPGYLQALRALCDKKDYLLMLDEIQCGVGRSGQWFSFQHENIIPDVLTAAKTLGNGIPIGAYIASAKACDIFVPNDHGSTQGGNPFACAVALTVLDTIEQENLLPHIQAMGERLQQGLEESIGKHPRVDKIQGQGLMRCIKLKEKTPQLATLGVAEKIIFNLSGGTTLRLLPAFIAQEQDIDTIIERVERCFKQV
jgi:acetylornithine/N-succinyldiaminopimelate aminotransferase